MADDGDKKEEYSREYTGHNPVPSQGPLTWVVGTILKPKPPTP